MSVLKLQSAEDYSSWEKHSYTNSQKNNFSDDPSQKQYTVRSRKKEDYWIQKIIIEEDHDNKGLAWTPVFNNNYEE